MKLRPVTHQIILLPAIAAFLVAGTTAEPANQDTRTPAARNPELTPTKYNNKGKAKPANRFAKKQQRKATRSETGQATPQPPPQPRDPNRLVIPFEAAEFSTPESQIDRLVLAELQKNDIQPARPCSDEVFIRRIFLDLNGTLPDPGEVHEFLRDDSTDKRSKLIDDLLMRDEFVDYWAMKWCDLLRVKSEFPINLWPNAVQAYHRWIIETLDQHLSYDKFVRLCLTSSGSNFRVPAVNFYRAIQGKDPEQIAAAVALTFMGSRIDTWPTENREGLQKTFSRVRFKPTAEWKEEIICNDPDPDEPLVTILPDGKPLRVAPGDDPRVAFADWLTKADNPWFARALVNRAWSWFFGRGIVHEPDDLRPDNPPSNPALLSHLERVFIASDYNITTLFRLITSSRTYQQASIPRSEHPDAGKLFAHYPVRRIEAEVLIDALCKISGTGEEYMSPIPEPFTFIPPRSKTTSLADGSITSQFLEMFGRPPRDTGLESERNNNPSDAQRLHLLNSTHIQNKIEQGWRLKNLHDKHRKNPALLARSLYVMILSRPPQPQELAAAGDYARNNKLNNKQAADDLIWALVNSKEFLYRH